MGRLVVAELIRSGRTVVAAVRDAAKAGAIFAELGVQEGYQQQRAGQGILFIEGGIDVTRTDTLGAELWRGATQAVSTLGPIFGQTADGTRGYLDNMTSERVDAQGVSNVAAAAAQHLPRQSDGAPCEVLSMRSADDLAKWDRLDDVIMGGQSGSALQPADDGSGAIWTGNLIIEGGGFCGARTKALDLNLEAFDGIYLRVKGDGQTFKLNLKTADQEATPESTYQATFDTIAGEWAIVKLPWREFVPVKRARYEANAPALDPAKVRQLGLVLSRFEFNGLPNPRYKPGKFELLIGGGIQAYKEGRPALVMVSSAGVERNALIGDDAEARKKDIPIVQLNPGGTLNHKYTGETAVRSSGAAYTVIRATGLTNEEEGGPFVVEASQGDRISGKVSRAEVAALVATAINSPAGAGKTIEVRRSEAAGDKGRGMTGADRLRLFLAAVPDSQRQRILLPPLPTPVPPPPPPSKERTAEILADERVKASQSAGRGGRVRGPEEAATAKSVTVVGDSRSEAASKHVDSSTPSNGAGPNSQVGSAAGVENDIEARKVQAQAWISNWRATGSSSGSSSNGSGANGNGVGDDIQQRKGEAQEWIASWKSRSGQ
ncbi:hypothetical protein WJX72_002437 [[Myrmecia] bisecta]|uniref:NADH:ubiquinone oxidoreductase intermediate-associated protein 30 domain-containing protein n=1 Tax=[Myrmecia] bisecta TaxID=41462 RepID=A0AAW1Q0K4_9CHLO